MWFQICPLWNHTVVSVIPVFPSVKSHCSVIPVFPSMKSHSSLEINLNQPESDWNQPESPWIRLKSTWITLNQLESDWNQPESPWITLKSNLMIQGYNSCIKRKSHRKLVRFFQNHFNQLVGQCVLLNHHSFRSFHSLHSWWFSRTHLPTRWFQWFRKNHTRLTVGFPIVCTSLYDYECCGGELLFSLIRLFPIDLQFSYSCRYI